MNEAQDISAEPVRVGIIGINGRFGQALRSFFEGFSCTVIGSDKSCPTGLTNLEVVLCSEVIIFSVPIAETPGVIRSVIDHVVPDQLLMDVTSIKEPAMEAMLEGTAQVVGLHPMFRPKASFDGETIVVCPGRLTLPKWKTWVANMLATTGARIKWSTPKEHDRYMTAVQVIPHLANLVSALLIMKSHVSVDESLAFTSPFYRLMFSLMGRLLSQDCSLYASIVMENPQTVSILERRIEIEKELLGMIRRGEHASFEQLFADASLHFGSRSIQEANDLFERLLAVLNTLYGKNSVTLEFSKKESRPGLLERISRIFGDKEINLIGINSVALGERVQFTISFEESPQSDKVRQALEEIEAWTEPQVKVLSSE